jgi:hypothetical protein
MSRNCRTLAVWQPIPGLTNCCSVPHIVWVWRLTKTDCAGVHADAGLSLFNWVTCWMSAPSKAVVRWSRAHQSFGRLRDNAMPEHHTSYAIQFRSSTCECAPYLCACRSFRCMSRGVHMCHDDKSMLRQCSAHLA